MLLTFANRNLRNPCQTFLMVLFLFLTFSLQADPPTFITLWHALDGHPAKVFEKIVADFNKHSGAYHVIAEKKGNYKEVYEKGVYTYLNEKPPHILQVYEVATLTAMLTPHIFKPVGEIMRTFHRVFEPNIYIDAVRNFYCDSQGSMLSFPWNASTGVLFYNKENFIQAGLNPDAPPQTWEELEAYLELLHSKGFGGFTTAWPYAYHLEHLCCLHNLPFATKANGFEGLSARLCFNEAPQIHHIAKLVEWQKKEVFLYAGRFNETPEELFIQGKCSFLLQGANRLSTLQKKANFSIGVSFCPHWKKFASHPYNLNIGGASFWVFAGFSKNIYRGISHFFSYLSSTEVQAQWHQETGYLPITEGAYYLTKKKGFYKDHPELEIPVLEVMSREDTPNTRGIRLGNYIQIRELITDYLEKAFSYELEPKEALDQAVLEGNKILKSYEKKRRH